MMLPTIATGVVAYLSTSMDALIILTIIFSLRGRHHFLAVYLGDLVGTAGLVLISLLCAFPLKHLPQELILAVLALVPLTLGVRSLIGRPVTNAQLIDRQPSDRSLFWEIAVIILSSGGDNISIYIPIFTQASLSQIELIVLTFALMVTLWCGLSWGLSHWHQLQFLERWGSTITGCLYLLIGVSLLCHALGH